MATLDELSVVVTGDIRQMQQSLQTAERGISKFAAQADQRLRVVDKAFSQVRSTAETALKSLSVVAPSLAIGLSINGLARAALDATDEFAKLARAADRLALSTDFFQSLRFAVMQTGEDVSLVETAFTSFGATLRETRSGASRLTSTLERLDVEALAAVRSARTQEQAFKAVADAVARATTQFERNEIATAAFGTAGSRLVATLSEGARGIDAFIAQARGFGVIIDEQMLRRAEEMDAQFKAAGQAIDLQFKQALIELAPILVSTASGVADISRGVNDLIDSFRELDERRTTRLQEDLAEARLRIDQLAAAQQRLMDGGADVERGLARRGMDRVEALRLNSELLMAEVARAKQIEDILAGRESVRQSEALPPATSGTGDLKAREQALNALKALEREFLRVTGQTAALVRIQQEDELQKFQQMLDQKLISAKQFEQARLLLISIGDRRLNELLAESRREIEEVARALESSLSGAFKSFVETGKVDFQALTAQIIADLAMIGFRMAILRPLFGSGQSGDTGFVGGLLGQVLHDGGVAGDAGPRRAVSALAFAGAQRLHDGGFVGLRPGEVPAILERGERVIPRGGDDRGRGPGVVVNISTPDVEGFRRNRGEIGAQIARAVARGQRNL